jgi:hypothetical protein
MHANGRYPLEILVQRRNGAESVTNQVTTTSGNGRQSATLSDTAIPPSCGNPTQPDSIRRNQHAW